MYFGPNSNKPVVAVIVGGLLGLMLMALVEGLVEVLSGGFGATGLKDFWSESRKFSVWGFIIVGGIAGYYLIYRQGAPKD